MYNKFMNYLSRLFKLFNFRTLDKTMVSNLYALSKRSIIATIFLSTLLTYYLYPMLTYSIILWNVAVICILVTRLYLVYDFQKNVQKHTIKKWYNIFVLCTFLTAFLFSLLASLSLFYLDEVHQIFIIAVMIGFTSGAMSSLFPDIRIVSGYMSIILLPLIAVLIVLPTSMHTVLAVLLMLYFVMQSLVILNTYRQSIDLEVQKGEVSKEQSKLHEKEKELAYFYKQAPIGIFSYDTQLNVKDCNQAFLELFGLKKEEIINRNLADLPDKRSLETIQNALIKGVQIYTGPYLSIKGFEYWVEAKCFPLFDNDQNTVGGIGLIENKTNEHKAVSELKFLALHDPLTDLLNRRGFIEYMKELVSAEEHKNSYSILFYIDLDQFKGINDSLGHTVGDNVLLLVSQRLVYMLDSRCKIIRLGGDEFIVIVPYISKDENELQDIISDYERNLIGLFHDPFIVDDLHLSIRSSIGMIIIEPNYTNIDEIIRHADITMYQAKNSNSEISYYNESMDTKQKEFFALQHDLAYAVERNEFDLFLQPIVTIKDDTLCSAEALIRWNHPTKGLLSPSDFIPLAIKAGILSQITWWVVDTVCYHIAQWKQENKWQLDYISINVNAQQLIENDFATKFLKKLKENGLDTSDIMIEITERSLIDSFDTTQDIINRLRQQGVKCAIDDFGIGYSSLSYLKRLSFNTLKIDREFVKDIGSNPNELLLVSSILDIGRQFNYNIVIEGIEDQKQKELLIGLDDELRYQGFHFSKPLHAEEFEERFLKVPMEEV